MVAQEILIDWADCNCARLAPNNYQQAGYTAVFFPGLLLRRLASRSTRLSMVLGPWGEQQFAMSHCVVTTLPQQEGYSVFRNRLGRCGSGLSISGEFDHPIMFYDLRRSSLAPSSIQMGPCILTMGFCWVTCRGNLVVYLGSWHSPCVLLRAF